MNFSIATNHNNLFDATKMALISPSLAIKPLNDLVTAKSLGDTVPTTESAVLYSKDNTGALKTFLVYHIVKEANGTVTLHKRAVVPKGTPAPDTILRPVDSELFVMNSAAVQAFLQSNPHDLHTVNTTTVTSSSSQAVDTTSNSTKLHEAAMKSTAKQLLASKGAFSDRTLQPLSSDPQAALLTGTATVIAKIRQFPAFNQSALFSSDAITKPHSIVNIHPENINDISSTFRMKPANVYPLQLIASEVDAKRAVSNNNTATILTVPIQWKREELMLSLTNIVAVLNVVLHLKPSIVAAFAKRLASIDATLFLRLNLVTPTSPTYSNICGLVFDSFNDGLENLYNSIIACTATEASILTDIATFSAMEDQNSHLFFNISHALLTNATGLKRERNGKDRKDKTLGDDKKPQKPSKLLCLFHYADSSPGCRRQATCKFAHDVVKVSASQLKDMEKRVKDSRVDSISKLTFHLHDEHFDPTVRA